MNVRELRQLLFNIENQETQIRVSASIEYHCVSCGTREEYKEELEFNGIDDQGTIIVTMYDRYNY